MLQLDLDKIDVEYQEFIRLIDLIVEEIGRPDTVVSIVKTAKQITKSYKNCLASEYASNVDDDVVRIVSSQILILVDFWLKNKETFLKIDRIIDHLENLPLKVIEQEETNEED